MYCWLCTADIHTKSPGRIELQEAATQRFVRRRLADQNVNLIEWGRENHGKTEGRPESGTG